MWIQSKAKLRGEFPYDSSDSRAVGKQQECTGLNLACCNALSLPFPLLLPWSLWVSSRLCLII